MKTLDKLKQKKNKMKAQMQRGREVTEQMKAEKIRRKINKTKLFEPGTIRFGLQYKQGIGEFMDDVKERRKHKREEKEKTVK